MLRRADETLRDVFGLHLEQGVCALLAASRPTDSFALAGTEFFLVNQIKLHDAHRYLSWRPAPATAGLALAVLGMLHCTPTGQMTEEALFETLAVIGFNDGNEKNVRELFFLPLCVSFLFLLSTRSLASGVP